MTTRQMLPPALGGPRARCPPQSQKRLIPAPRPLPSSLPLFLFSSSFLALPEPAQVTRALPTPLLSGLLWGFPDHSTGTAWLEPTGPRESTTSRLSSRTLPASPHPGGKGQEARPVSPPPPLPLPREGKCQIPCLSGGSGRVGGGVIQPQECGVRRAFPAITRRGRDWCANGFNYHSDRNTGRLTPSQLVPGTPTRYPAGPRGRGAAGWASQGSRDSLGVAVLPREPAAKATKWEWCGCSQRVRGAQGMARSKAGQGAWRGPVGLGGSNPSPEPSHPREPWATPLKSPVCGELHAVYDEGKRLNLYSQPANRLHPLPSPPPRSDPGCLLAPAHSCSHTILSPNSHTHPASLASTGGLERQGGAAFLWPRPLVPLRPPTPLLSAMPRARGSRLCRPTW